MPRPRHRVCLQSGLKLDLNRLARKGCIRFGANIGIRAIMWTDSYWGEIASGLITADMTNPNIGWLEISIGGFRQRITLIPRPRHFGGHSRQAWGKQVAYRSQFLDRDNRAHAGKERIKERLIGDLNPDEWEFPPKPKWMRSKTYKKYEERFDRYEEILDYGFAEAAANLAGLEIF